MFDQENWEEIFRTNSQMEADVVRGLLEANGFPVVVETRGLKSMPFFFGHAATGELILKVPPDMAGQARQMLEAEAEFPPEE